MSETLFTITSADGLRLSAIPGGGTCAYLFYHELLAHDHIEHLDNPDQWEMRPVEDLEEWLTSLAAENVTHVYKVMAVSLSQMEEIGLRLDGFQIWRDSPIGRIMKG